MVKSVFKSISFFAALAWVSGCAGQTAERDSMVDEEEVGTSTQAFSAGNEAFQANTGKLWIDGADSGVAMAPRTSPGAAAQRVFIQGIGTFTDNPCYAVQSSAGRVLVWRGGVLRDVGATVAGTSPTVAVTAGNQCIVAFHATNHFVQTYNFSTAKTTFFAVKMAAGTSPSIVERGSSNDFQIAVQASNGELYTTGSLGLKAWGVGMAAGTSPSIAPYGGGVQIAFQANTGKLWTVGEAGTKQWNLGIATGTSPSITFDLNNGDYKIAINAAGTNRLWTVGSGSTKEWTTVVMAPNTSPSMASWKAGSGVLVQSNAGQLVSIDWKANTIVNRGLGMAAQTSPASS